MMFSGNAVLQGSNPGLMTLIINDCSDLVGMSVAKFASFGGIYTPASKTAAITMPPNDFDTFRQQLGGASVPITLTVNQANRVTEFCYGNRCLAIDRTTATTTESPRSDVKGSGAESNDAEFATGTGEQ